MPLVVWVLASLLFACDRATEPTATTTTTAPQSQILSEPLGLGAEPGGGGRGTSTFSVNEPGTLTVHWRGEIVPVGGSADFLVTLLRYVNGQSNCEDVVEGVLCLGIRNARNEKDATLVYVVEEPGQHSFVVVLRNLGPNGVSGHVTVDFNRQ